jgi:hypothetical protein
MDVEQVRALSLLNQEQVAHYWPDILRELRETNMYEFWTPEQIFERLANGAMQCWALSDSEIRLILLTDVIVYASGVRVLRFVGGVGKRLKEFLPLIVEVFGRITRQLKCDHVEVAGRKGWERLLKPYGFKHSFTVLTLDLELVPKKDH